MPNTVRYQGQIAYRKPNITKLSQSGPKHALKVTAGAFGVLPGAIQWWGGESAVAKLLETCA